MFLPQPRATAFEYLYDWAHNFITHRPAPLSCWFVCQQGIGMSTSPDEFVRQVVAILRNQQLLAEESNFHEFCRCIVRAASA
jgi:hypothetical protein